MKEMTCIMDYVKKMNDELIEKHPELEISTTQMTDKMYEISIYKKESSTILLQYIIVKRYEEVRIWGNMLIEKHGDKSMTRLDYESSNIENIIDYLNMVYDKFCISNFGKFLDEE